MIFTFKVHDQEIGQLSAEESTLKIVGTDAGIAANYQWITTPNSTQLLFLKQYLLWNKTLDYFMHELPTIIFTTLKREQQITFETLLAVLVEKPVTCFLSIIHLSGRQGVPLTINDQYTGYVQTCNHFPPSGALEIVLTCGKEMEGRKD